MKAFPSLFNVRLSDLERRRGGVERFTDSAIHDFYLLPLQDAGPGYDLIGHLRLSLSSRDAGLVGKRRRREKSKPNHDQRTASRNEERWAFGS